MQAVPVVQSWVSSCTEEEHGHPRALLVSGGLLSFTPEGCGLMGQIMKRTCCQQPRGLSAAAAPEGGMILLAPNAELRQTSLSQTEQANTV